MSPKPTPPTEIEVPEIPGMLSPGTPRVDKTPQNPQHLPEFARPRTAPNSPKAALAPASRTTQPPDRHQADLAEAIVQTHLGVEALQVLIEAPEEPTRADTILELLEAIDNRTFRMEERQKAVEAMLSALMKHLRLPISKT